MPTIKSDAGRIKGRSFLYYRTQLCAESQKLPFTMKGATLATLLAVVASSEAQFNPLEHLGGNSPFFRGPNVFDISPDAPEGCSVDQAAFSSRHGSRYPDPGAYNEWLDLSTKVLLD